MKLEEAIVYLLASAGYGMKTDQITREINERRLYVRRDGQPVSDRHVYAIVMSHLETFVKADGAQECINLAFGGGFYAKPFDLAFRY